MNDKSFRNLRYTVAAAGREKLHRQDAEDAKEKRSITAEGAKAAKGN